MKKPLLVLLLALVLCTGITSAIIEDYNPNLIYLTHLNGANGGSTFTDELGYTILNTGTPTTSTTQFKWDSSLSAPASSDNNIYYNNARTEQIKTISVWAYRPSAWSLNPGMFGAGDANGYVQYVAGRLRYYDITNTEKGNFGTPPINTWNQYVLISNGTHVNCYVNGSMTSETAYTSNLTSGSQLAIGSYISTGASAFEGYIDEFAAWGVAVPISEIYPQANPIAYPYYPSSSASILASPTASTNTGNIYATNVSLTVLPSGLNTPQNWSFGDGYTSTQRNATNHLYPVAGLYTINWSSTNITAPFGFQNASATFNQTSDYDTNVKSWMHMNGVAGGSTFQDIGGNAWTPNSVTTENAVIKFGSTSAFFNGDGDRLSSATSPNFDFGTEDFTVELWVYPTFSSVGRYIISRSTYGGALSDGWGVYHSSPSATSNGWKAWFGSAATQTGTFTLPLNQWNYLVLQRTNGVVNVSVNGVYATGVAAAGNYDTPNAVSYGDPITGGKASRMYLDETRISTAARWITGGERFDPPWAEYRGDLFGIADPNPDSTMRMKTNPSPTPPGNVIMNNLTARNRTVQIQNVSIANNISTTLTFNNKHVFAKAVYRNASKWTGINLTYVNIDNANGEVTINATRTGGFSTNGSVDNRASFADIQMVYYNYTQFDAGTTWSDNQYAFPQYFANGYLKNTTTGQDYPVMNFLATNVTFTPWITFSNFTVSNAAPIVNENQVQFAPEMNFTANRFLWDYGDGITETTTNGVGNHTYTLPGTYRVNLTSYLWQNTSVSNTTATSLVVAAVYNSTYVKADFTSSQTSGNPGLLVTFADTSIFTNATAVKKYYWVFGDGTAISNLANPSHVYSTLGTYSVNLTVTNTDNLALGWDTEIKENYITISSNQQTTWYSPAQVQIKIVDSAGTPIQGVMVSATPLNFTAPANWAEILIGIQPTVNISGTTVSGLTGTDGSWVAPVLQSYRYHWTFVNATAGINSEQTFYPSESTYRIFINTNTAVNNTYENLAGTNLTFAQPNASFMTLGMNYLDTSGTTENVTFTVSSWKNDTVMFSQTFTGGFTASTVTSSYTLQNVRGDEFAWAYKAYRTDGSVLSQGNMLVAKGPSGVLVDLGIPIDWYRWLSLCILFLLAGLSSQRTKQFWVILIPIFAAIFFWFGWFVPTGGLKEETILIGVIIMCAVLGVMLYMKSALREKHGVGGPGSMLLNIVFYLIVLQASIGFINGLQVWSDDYSTAASTIGYKNVDITTDIPVVTNAGGGLIDTISIGMVMLEMSFSVLRMVFEVLRSIVFIYPQLMMMFPFLAQSAQTQALLVLLQIGIYIVYLLFFLRLVRGEMGTVEL